MKKVVLLLACGLLTSTFVFAQGAPKIGWIETSELLSSMPERIKADSDVAKYARQFQETIDMMMKEYETKGKQYQANEKTMTDAMKEVKLKEIQDLQNRIETTQQSANEKLQQKKQDVYTPILDKATKAIQAVAKEKGYDYIFDKSAGGLLFAKEGENILPLVKAKMGIK